MESKWLGGGGGWGCEIKGVAHAPMEFEAVHEVQERRYMCQVVAWRERSGGTHEWRCLPHLLVGSGTDLSSSFFDHRPILAR